MKSTLYVALENTLDASMKQFKQEIQTNRECCLLLVPDEKSEFVDAIVAKTGAEVKKA